MKHNAKSFSNLIGELVTTDDLDTLREELAAVKEDALVPNTPGSEVKLKELIRPRILKAIKADLKAFDEDARSYAREAMEVAAKLPLMELTLAYEPTPVGLRRILEKLRSISNQQYILSLIVNPALLGGMVCVLRGEFRDYSLSNKLGQLMTEMYPGIEEQ
jgi:hypothetical protein